MAVTISGSGPVTGLTTINSITVPTSTFGKILQVVEGTTTTRVDLATVTFTDTNLSCTITPLSNTSRILILVSQKYDIYRASSTTIGMALRILRGASTVVLTDTSGNPWGSARINAAIGSTYVVLGGRVSLQVFDSPATTSAVTYKTQGQCFDSSTNLVFNDVAASSMILMEVAA